MDVCHVLLGRPWLYNCPVIHDGYLNTYTFPFKNREITLTLIPLSEETINPAKMIGPGISYGARPPKKSDRVIDTSMYDNKNLDGSEHPNNSRDIVTVVSDEEGKGEITSPRIEEYEKVKDASDEDIKAEIDSNKEKTNPLVTERAGDDEKGENASEAFRLRRNQELEAEGESTISGKSDYDRLHTELEYALLSIKCYKEEKEKLVALLQECEDGKSRNVDELSLIREKLVRKRKNGSARKVKYTVTCYYAKPFDASRRICCPELD